VPGDSSKTAGRMPFPESKRVVYRNNPLVEVICQLRFPTILEISATDPAGFQNRIRDHYPLYERPHEGQALPKEIEGILDRLPIPRFPEGITHKFLVEDSSRFISLTPDFLAITERNYRKWENFSLEITRALEALEGEYHPAFYSRTGLRYVDVIDKGALGLQNEPWESLLNPAVVGILAEGDLCESVRDIQGRALIALGEDVVAGGLATLRYGLTKLDAGDVAYQFDVDLFTTERSTGGDVARILAKFNQLAGHLFRWAITHKLEEALGPMEIG